MPRPFQIALLAWGKGVIENDQLSAVFGHHSFKLFELAGTNKILGVGCGPLPGYQGYRVSTPRSEEHTSELQSRGHLVCRLLLEKKKKTLESHSNSYSKI